MLRRARTGRVAVQNIVVRERRSHGDFINGVCLAAAGAASHTQWRWRNPRVAIVEYGIFSGRITGDIVLMAEPRPRDARVFEGEVALVSETPNHFAGTEAVAVIGFDDPILVANAD